MRFRLAMPRQRKSKGPSGSGKAGQQGNGKIVCALCGRTITDGSEQPVIYSICAACKKLPHRNPRSAA
jgi:hypothetical protein